MIWPEPIDVTMSPAMSGKSRSPDAVGVAPHDLEEERQEDRRPEHRETDNETHPRDDSEGAVGEEVEGKHRFGGTSVDERPDDGEHDAEDAEDDDR